MQLTPMMQQYMEIKEKYQDCILFFRLGDFYEMFFEDAITASREMEITLTGKNYGQEEKAPMCGVPYHAADSYIAKLIEKGYKVAICEQVEDPATAKGIVKREVVQIITPGTVVSQNMLNERENNYLASVFLHETGAGIAYCDISTGEINTTQLTSAGYTERLLNELVKIKAKEVIANDYANLDGFIDEMKITSGAYISILPDQYYIRNAAEEFILRQFQVKSLKGLGIEESDLSIMALGALLAYLFETQKQGLSHLSYLNVYDTAGHMSLDKATIKNLELTETLFEKKIQGSLLGVLDKTHTAMGSRKMKQWLREPLNNLKEIQERLDAVELLSDQILLRNNLKESLKKIYDLERLAGRIACGNANGKDLIALRNSIFVLPDMKSELAACGDSFLEKLEEKMDSLSEIYDLIDQSIQEEPPFTIKEGGIIKEGYSLDLDQIKHSIKDGQSWIAGLEGTEKERTGIKSLKVGFNKVFGYYIEVTKSYFDLVPENYIRKQTLANCERYITPELKEVESVVLNAETKINQLEYEIFLEIRKKIQDYISVIQITSGAVSTLDVLVSFSEVSSKLGYVKPQVNKGDVIRIEKGRHPVIETTIKDGIFVSNDTYVDRKDSSMLLITGPNMAGKSTYMRQTALIVLMSQAGCFVPAEAAQIGIVDRIYTRIGASDNLAQGQSTFFVEMSELAYILNTATEKSLIILDEIGRGTSTYDGLSIAWAVVEYLCNSKYHVRTLFATHYHELTSLEGIMKGLKNLNVDVQEKDGNIIFLHKIVEGSASRSYGIHVAKLAGVPASVLETAQEKLHQLEATAVSIDLDHYEKELLAEQSPVKEETEQISFFSFAPNPVVERLKALDLMNITPSQAFGILEDLKKAAEN
ncbi:DNA mismatch repair protein MutS [Sinanaerobacter chloroacetimidivorans]|uniref:DNA mismatch repair protein MutS n=1 Tax=Sinanaerobacter chloroacetimidivorans TaxID=2818044 RepID=A0A8J7W093_9FIRM|nr:DNA mismatch repair protein MutS [Sinanaerobacter chloroacetimidivorans]MBR0596615.1 DNA mismatch repair protein MutS [Sinanaerobacter chloroacetimidivorans]